jgi:hypothetical protein
MAKLVFGLNQCLDGDVDHLEFAPGPALFRHSSSSAWPDRQRVRSPHVRGDALLG